MWSWIYKLFSKGKGETNSSVEEVIDEQIDSSMKYLVVGLGNIGREYDNTRHNIGFDVVDALAEEKEASWKTDTLGDVATIKHKGRSITLLKPSTYMNRSGKATNYWMQKLKIDRNNLLVIVDDLHIDFGKLRLRAKGSDGGHNGLKDIQQVLGGSNYTRLRFGIGKDFHSGEQVKYVLGKWTPEQQEDLPKYIKKAADACLSFATIGMKFTMEKYNR